MPIYEYECTKCHSQIEALQNFSDKPLTKCEHCSGKLQKLISHSAFHLKGSGWYVTDYAGGPGKSSNSSEKKAEPEKKETKKTEKKADKASE